MEADVLPVSAVLVAGPDSAETLCGSPAVQGDNVRTLAYACGYDIVSSLGTVQSEVVAVAYPCNISLQGSDSANFYLFLEITKQVPGGVTVGIRAQIALCPKTCLQTLALCILGELFQIVYIGVYCCSTLCTAAAVRVHAAGLIVAVLTIAAAISVVGKEVADGHVIFVVLIDDSSCGILGIGIHGRILVQRSSRLGSVQRLGAHTVLQHIACAHTGLIIGRCNRHLVCSGCGRASLDLPFLASAIVGPGVTVVAV